MKKNIRYILIAIMLMVTCLAGSLSPANKVYAATMVKSKYDDINVLSDLNTAVIGGKEFTLEDYPKNPHGEMKVITFVEYCYSFYENSNDNYSLYVYVYNPTLVNVSENSVLNKLQIAVSFDGDKVTSYSKFGLKLCNKSTGDYDKLFYKFKVLDSSNTILNIIKNYAKAHSGIRPYHIGEIKLLTIGNLNATAYTVGYTNEYTGFAEGYRKSNDFPLGLEVYSLETLPLDVHHTFYRPDGTSSSSTHTQNQLNSVYFAVPNKMLKKYGEMYAAHVEWYEYLTKEVFVTGNKSVYDGLINYIGKRIQVYDNDVYYGLAASLGVVSGFAVAEDSYNMDFYQSRNVLDTLYYLFYSGNVPASDYSVSVETLTKYILDYSNKHSSYGIQEKYSSDLFCNYVDKGRKVGYNEHFILAADDVSLVSYVLNQTWWEQLWGIKNYTKTIYDGIKGIQEVKAADFVGTQKQICDKLFIDESNYSDFRSAYLSSVAANETLFLMRFAVTDYVSKPVVQYGGHGFWDVNLLDNNAYMAQETVFLDFDIIDVSFYKDGIITVIPVVSSPIDIFSTITPPVNVFKGCGNTWETVLSVFLIVVLVVLSYKLIRFFFGKK